MLKIQYHVSGFLQSIQDGLPPALNASFPCLKNFLCVRKNNEDILLYHSNLTHKKAL